MIAYATISPLAGGCVAIAGVALVTRSRRSGGGAPRVASAKPTAQAVDSAAAPRMT
jgi:hypothetical protein